MYFRLLSTCTLFGSWHNKMYDLNSHQWCINLPRGAKFDLQRVIIWFGRLGLRGRVRVNLVAMVGLVSC